MLIIVFKFLTLITDNLFDLNFVLFLKFIYWILVMSLLKDIYYFEIDIS